VTPPYQAYFRVWSGWSHTPAEHEEFHRALWAARSDGGVVRLMAELLEKSGAADADKLAVTNHLHADWQTARVLASMASSATAFEPVDFAATLTRLRTAAGLSVPDLARKSGLSDDTLRRWEAGDPKRLPTWEAVQKLAAALGVPTDTFRDTPGA
jgi:DNA-binding XRE family transcriptional regulator